MSKTWLHTRKVQPFLSLYINIELFFDLHMNSRSNSCHINFVGIKAFLLLLLILLGKEQSGSV